ncbi:MAG: recombinase family protein [Microcystaceae cyanobacterium]
MSQLPIWIQGPSQTGKSQRLCDHFQAWAKTQTPYPLVNQALIFAANEATRRPLGDRLLTAVQGCYPVQCQTFLGFIEAEILLFWPLLIQQIPELPPFPLKLRPETEQALALEHWEKTLGWQTAHFSPDLTARVVRDSLDLMQLAGAAGIPPEEIPERLSLGWPSERLRGLTPQQYDQFLVSWRRYCLHNGFLTYGLTYEIYGRYLLPYAPYQAQLTQRFTAIFADDLDDYPAIARDLIEFLLNQGAWGVFTFNPDGQVRLGLNADPDYLAGLVTHCAPVILTASVGLAPLLVPAVLALVADPLANVTLPGVEILQTVSRAKLLQAVGDRLITALKEEDIQPQDIAILAPGLDDVARYSLMKHLNQAGIDLTPLNEQRPLISEAWVRALLTLLALVYPHLGRFALRESVAEMLVVLRQTPDPNGQLIPQIDPVRAGLFADVCFQPHPDHPQCLAITTYGRWDRFGYQASQAYQTLIHWIHRAQTQIAHCSPLDTLYQAIEDLIPPPRYLSFSQLASLRELMETAQHFWEVETERQGPTPEPSFLILGRFLELLRLGTISANPSPLTSWGKTPSSITLATLFQYRSARLQHRWHFWLDVGSDLWAKGGAAQLLAAPLFQRPWTGEFWDTSAETLADQARLERILRDLLGRVREKLFLCHSDLNIRGLEQQGPLLGLLRS